MPKKRKSKPARLPNRTIWALEDILAEVVSARSALEKAIERAERSQDVPLLIALSRVNNSVATIHVRAAQARRGE